MARTSIQSTTTPSARGGTEVRQESPAKSYKRKLTEARCEQNRRSQRVWREKQKRQRDEEVKARVQEELQKLGSRSRQEPLLVLDGEAGTEAETELLVSPWTSRDRIVAAAATDISQPQPQPQAHREHHPLVCEVDQPLAVEGDRPVTSSASSTEDAGTRTGTGIHLPDPVLPLTTALYYFLPADPHTVDMRCFWPCPEGIEHNLYEPPPKHLPKPSSSDYVSTITTATPPPPAPPRVPLSGSRGRLPLPVPAPLPSSPSSTRGLPSPYLNHLQLVGESCFAATLSIATGLGITRASYVNDHPSPFSFSSSTPTTSTSLSTVANNTIHTFQTIPIDLRPSAIQIMLPHPCYLDCIPFPHFRSMAVYLSSLGRLDHCSFFLDIMHDGMVCWGSSSSSRHGGGGGVPWNRRSWEVKPWFWRKWGWIARTSVEEIDAGVPVPVPVPVPPVQHRETETAAAVETEVDDEDGMLSGSRWWWSLQDDDEECNGSGSGVSASASVPEPEYQQQEELGSYLSRMRTANVGLRQTNEKHLLRMWDGVREYRYVEV